jgi:3-oxoacyl-[acyl-carrier protein] reductase
MAQSLAGKTALVTGASRGLGDAIARKLIHLGANVALSAKNPFDAPTGATKITTHVADLSDPRIPDQLITEILSAHGRIDILINNAAVQGPIGAFESVDFEQWSDVFDVNFFAAARLIQLVIPHMRAGGGKIVNLSGGGAASPRPHVSAYGASKCALVRLTETLALELKLHRIDINAVAPGPMNTRMLDEIIRAGPDGAPLEFNAAQQRKQQGGADPERAAELVAFLVSSASDGITGRLISAVWDDWKNLRAAEIKDTDLYTLRRVT